MSGAVLVLIDLEPTGRGELGRVSRKRRTAAGRSRDRLQHHVVNMPIEGVEGLALLWQGIEAPGGLGHLLGRLHGRHQASALINRGEDGIGFGLCDCLRATDQIPRKTFRDVREMVARIGAAGSRLMRLLRDVRRDIA